MSKSTNKELVEELEKINIDGKLDKFIERAKANYYHDFKQPEDIICGKVQFVSESTDVPELQDLRSRIIAGEFDEDPDEDDKEEMRKDLPPSMWAAMGLAKKLPDNLNN